ncbi:MAG: InlB B-repeat-containing protein [Dysgonomonas sp.]
MKNFYRIFPVLLSLVLFLSCNDTKLGDKDLDFDVTIDNKELISYVGKPVKIGISVSIADPLNDYPFETKIKSPAGLLKTGTDVINSEQKLEHDYRNKGTLFFEYTPTKKGKETVTVTIKNELVTRIVSCDIDCKDALYNIEINDAPDRPLIDTKFDFNLIVHEMDATGADSIVAYAKVLKGEGTVYSGEDIINMPLSGTEDLTKSTPQTTRLAIGKNNISYKSSKEGENVIRFYFTNKWGIETYQDIMTPINLPDWSLENSMGSGFVEVPYKDSFSFNLSVNETDIFKDNQYTAFFRILSNTDLELSINDKKYNQGASFGLKAGGNVGVLKVNDAAQQGIIEFIVKDKYKQEYKDTIRFASKLPLKPIEASLDKSSQSVKVNQAAIFKLTLSEQNYNGLFEVSFEKISGNGTFDGGNKLLFSEGTHNIKYTPNTQGAHTFKITIKDSNNQEKILNATVQATISPLAVSLSSTTLNIGQGDKGQVTLTTSEADYTGNFNISYTVSGIANKFEFAQVNLGVGGTATYKQGDNIITITGASLGTSTYNLIIEDDYKQKKELSLKTVVKGKVSVIAGAGGTASGGGNFDLNQSCTVKATPDAGYTFLGWYVGSSKVSENATYAFNVTESVNLAKYMTKIS